MSHLAPAKTKRDLNLIALFEEALNRFHLNFVIVIVDIWPKLDFLNLNGLLLFSSLCGFLLSLKFIFAVVHNLADGDFSVCRDLDKIQTRFQRARQSIALVYGSVIFTAFVDELDIPVYNCFVNARPVLGGRACNWASYLSSPYNGSTDRRYLG